MFSFLKSKLIKNTLFNTRNINNNANNTCYKCLCQPLIRDENTRNYLIMFTIKLQKEKNLQKRSFFSLHISKVITTNCLELELCLHNKELRDVCLPYNWTPDSIINLGQTLEITE